MSCLWMAFSEVAAKVNKNTQYSKFQHGFIQQADILL
nr:MAG TPA: hypothetical protein [Caudoviricetes sp.]